MLESAKVPLKLTQKFLACVSILFSCIPWSTPTECFECVSSSPAVSNCDGVPTSIDERDYPVHQKCTGNCMSWIRVNSTSLVIDMFGKGCVGEWEECVKTDLKVSGTCYNYTIRDLNSPDMQRLEDCHQAGRKKGRFNRTSMLENKTVFVCECGKYFCNEHSVELIFQGKYLHAGGEPSQQHPKKTTIFVAGVFLAVFV